MASDDYEQSLSANIYSPNRMYVHIQWLSKLTNHLRKEKCSIFIFPTKGVRDVKLSLCCRALLVVCLVSVSIKSFLSFIFLFRKNKKVRNFFASKLTNQYRNSDLFSSDKVLAASFSYLFVW